MAKKKNGKFNKSRAIKETAKETGKIGKYLAAALKEKYPEFAAHDPEKLAGYCSSVLSQAKAAKKKAKKTAAAAAVTVFAAPAPAPAAAKADDSKDPAPFLAQLKTLTAMLGRKAVKEMVDNI